MTLDIAILFILVGIFIIRYVYQLRYIRKIKKELEDIEYYKQLSKYD
jgi:hypothetical protein